MNFIFDLKSNLNYYNLKKQHNIMTGIGSCGRNGSTDANTYFCGTGPQCNNFDGKTCWNPVGNNQSITPCTSSQWQCKVNIFFCISL